jgi:hypothetical protein
MGDVATREFAKAATGVKRIALTNIAITLTFFIVFILLLNIGNCAQNPCGFAPIVSLL